MHYSNVLRSKPLKNIFHLHNSNFFVLKNLFKIYVTVVFSFTGEILNKYRTAANISTPI